jgi:hypothetical protein
MATLLTRLTGKKVELSDNEIHELTAQFYVTLEAYFLKTKSAGPPRCQDAYERVERLFAQEPRNWTTAYAIEQLLVHLFDDGTVESELQVRVQEAKGALRPGLAEYYALEVAKTTLSPDQRRALLSRIVNDLQWRYTVNEVKRSYTKEITLKTGQLFIASLIIFAASVLMTLRFPELQQFDVRLLVPAVLAGCWGAAFSMLSSLRDRLAASELDDLKLLRARWVLASRLLIGAGAASVIYFFFVSGLVTGAAFPELKAAMSDAAQIDSGGWLRIFALLVVWCFVAGFSERLIPGLIARTEARLEGSPAPDRFRPPSAAVPEAKPASVTTPQSSETGPVPAAAGS